MRYVEFSALQGQTLTKIDVVRGDEDSITFHAADGKQYRMYHDQDCCESVTIEDICGDTDNLIGEPLLVADERTNSSDDNAADSYTWTFYHLCTVKGCVTLRWYGTSNGYYSESVNLVEVTP